jgi:hypothetical protein
MFMLCDMQEVYNAIERTGLADMFLDVAKPT